MDCSGLVSQIEVTEDFIFYPDQDRTSQRASTEVTTTWKAAQTQKDRKPEELQTDSSDTSGLVSQIEVTEDFIYYPDQDPTSQRASTEATTTAQTQKDTKQEELHSIIERNHLLNIISSKAYSCYPGSCCCIVEEGRMECIRPEVYTCCSRHHEVLEDLQQQVVKRNENRRLFQKLQHKQDRFAWVLDYKEVNVIKKHGQPVSLSASLQKVLY